jgi:hypothetical protein
VAQRLQQFTAILLDTQVAKIYGTMDDLRLENARVQEMYMAP